mmetsp:Transcript_13626/g.26313  ORF Transcript_13626/g.26313 Transcript_13626/m.26313 type:complete len:269 (+) Transcript_13626:50-856(+)|eukprot:CAMPEP_0171500422 /NCGR_PEP_ID=MMETSP0958-20121227/8980_1 /TAXON_ID=87120 /ORGANISM="Aurantiochytrium limacinum, Strain ATCCMYA-1381" /LENGTH=268 /DNA_ID=CAMNT_0012035097 /DNA_START=54 /DNA_END=860 /DNA_ORIENTATION=+
MGCCATTSYRYLVFLNTLLSLIGLAILAYGIYAYIEYKDVLENINTVAPYGGIILGAIIFIVGMMGCLGVQKQNKPILVIFWIIMTALMIFVLMFGIALIIYLGYLDNAATDHHNIAKAVKRINDYEMGVYETCCIDGGYTTAEVPSCSSINATSGCYYSEEDMMNANVGDSLCNALEETTIDSVTIVSTEGCSSPETFHDIFTTFLHDNILPIGITLIVLGVVMLFALIATCVIICSNRYDYDAAYRAKVQQQEAGVVAGTQPVQYS